MNPDDVPERILSKKRTNRPIIIGIDGIDGSGKSTYAEQLASEFIRTGHHTHIISLDSFHNPKEFRYRQGELSPIGYYEDSFNYELITERCLTPIQEMDETDNEIHVQTSSFDFTKDSALPSFSIVRKSDIVIVEGIFLFRDELVDYFDYKIFIHADFSTIIERVINRRRDIDYYGTTETILEKYKKRYLPAQQKYLGECMPHLRADCVIDNDSDSVPFMVTNPFLIIFDCDGVLVETEKLYCKAFTTVLKTEFGIDLTIDEMFELVSGLSGKDGQAKLSKLYNIDISDRCMNNVRYIYAEHKKNHIKSIDNIEYALEKLSKITKCVASGSNPKEINDSLTLTGLDKYLPKQNWFSSSYVERGKPFPDVFLYAAKKMGFEPENSIIVEDSINGVKAAVAAGIKVLGYTKGDPEHGEKLKAVGATRTFADMSELPVLIIEEMYYNSTAISSPSYAGVNPERSSEAKVA